MEGTTSLQFPQSYIHLWYECRMAHHNTADPGIGKKTYKNSVEKKSNQFWNYTKMGT